MAAKKLAPVADELDRQQEFARDNFKAMSELGLTGIGIPGEYGGSDGGELSVAVAVEEIAWACAATADILDTHLCLCTKPIYTSVTSFTASSRNSFVYLPCGILFNLTPPSFYST